MALKDSFANVPTKQKVLLVCMLFLAIVVGFYYLIYRGMASEKEGLAQRRDALLGELREKRILAANLERLKLEITALESQLADALLVLPEEREIPSLLVNINSLGLKSGIEFLLFRPGSLAMRDFYGEFPVQMKVQGTYHGLGRFFDMISKMPRIVNVSELKISPFPPSEEAKDTIIAEFAATTFTFSGARGGKGSGSAKGK